MKSARVKLLVNHDHLVVLAGTILPGVLVLDYKMQRAREKSTTSLKENCGFSGFRYVQNECYVPNIGVSRSPSCSFVQVVWL